MNNSEQQSRNKENTGVIPNREISGSDADKVYDQDGNFTGQKPVTKTEKGRFDNPEGSDADSLDQ